MRKLKKINGYLVVRFNDREKREYEGTGLGNFGVIDAELYTGILDVDRMVMEYDGTGPGPGVRAGCGGAGGEDHGHHRGRDRGQRGGCGA